MVHLIFKKKKKKKKYEQKREETILYSSCHQYAQPNLLNSSVEIER